MLLSLSESGLSPLLINCRKSVRYFKLIYKINITYYHQPASRMKAVEVKSLKYNKNARSVAFKERNKRQTCPVCVYLIKN